jgi:hypothetical protein
MVSAAARRGRFAAGSPVAPHADVNRGLSRHRPSRGSKSTRCGTAVPCRDFRARHMTSGYVPGGASRRTQNADTTAERPVQGGADSDHISTGYVERQNLTLRMGSPVHAAHDRVLQEDREPRWRRSDSIFTHSNFHGRTRRRAAPYPITTASCTSSILGRERVGRTEVRPRRT